MSNQDPRCHPSVAGRDRAVVIGASMAGLLTARVLADRFGQVIVVDHDCLPDAPTFRKGVPQARHLHVLLTGGRAVVERLFPGFGSEMLGAGAIEIEMPRDARWLAAGGWFRRFDGGMKLLCSTRELLEWTVRRRVALLPNVRFLQECEAVGLLATADRSAVTGVRLRDRTAPVGSPTAEGSEPLFSSQDLGDEGADLMAALVVDASGRQSRAPEWLRALGYPVVEETTINAFLGYASRQYAMPKGFAEDWKILFLQAKPPAAVRTGLLVPVEDGRWFVSLMGAGRAYPPTDEDGFLAFARGLRSPLLYEAIKDAEPLTPIFGHRGTENRLRHYDRMERRPGGFVVVGDAACAFNPVYAQGMTVAAKTALALDRCLRDRRGDGDLTGFAGEFQREVARTAATAWMMSTGEDLRYPATEGATLDRRTRLTQRYLDRVLATATRHPGVNRAFVEVMNLNAAPTSLFRPSVLLPVLRMAQSDGAAAPVSADHQAALAKPGAA